MSRAVQQMQELKRPVSCIYVKIYLPVEQQDAFLVETVAPAVREWLAYPSAQYFFFIRYFDQRGSHLRLRVFGDRALVRGVPRRKFLQQLESAMGASSVEGSPSAALELGRYRPELRRYGGSLGVRLAERLFAASSDVVLRFLSLRQAGHAVSTTEFAVTTLEVLLDGIGMREGARNQFIIDHARDADLHGHGAPDTSEHAQVEHALDEIHAECVPDPLGYWADRDEEVAAIVAAFHRELKRWFQDWAGLEGQLTMPLEWLASSYYHMHANRLGIFPTVEFLIRRSRKNFALRAR